MKGYVLSAATAGIGAGVNPANLGFNVQSVQQVARATFVEAGLRTAIIGGSFKDNLGQAAVGQAANIVSGLIYKNLGDELRFSGTTSKVITHGIVGGLVAEAAGGSFKTGAIAAGLNEALVDTIIDLEFFQGPQHAQLVAMTSQLIGMTSAALVGGDEKEQQKAGWVAQQASLYNGLEHPTAERMLKELKDCRASGQCTDAKIESIEVKYKELSAARSKGINECNTRNCVESILDKTIAMDDPVAKDLLRFFQGQSDVPGLLQGNPDVVSAPSANPFNKNGDRFVTDNQVAFAKYVKEGWLTAEETKFLDGWMKSTQWLERTYERPLSLQERATILASFSEEALLGVRGRVGQDTIGAGRGNGATSTKANEIDIRKASENNVDLPVETYSSAPKWMNSVSGADGDFGALNQPSGNSKVVAFFNPQRSAVEALNNGRIHVDDLKRLVPPGSPDNFMPSASITNGSKYNYMISGQKVEIKWHSPDVNAATKYPGSNSGSGWTAQIKIGGKLLGQDGKLYRKASNLTHIPVDF